ncbi:MAG: twin-arginine translocase TatA/TatE family subunit [Rhodospirillaceae bacterium]|nr:twin-arginine translocase TatA/TatE family subunit [Rhodospirillaceae bacterium]
MGISFWHIVVVLLVVVLLFGAGKIPRLMKDLGSGITAFKRGLKDNEGEGAQPPAQAASPQIGQQPAGEKKAEEAVRRT